MKALLIWNNLWADRCVCFLHSLAGTSDIPVLCAEDCFPVSSHCGLRLSSRPPSSPIYLLTLRLPRYLSWCSSSFLHSPLAFSFCVFSFPSALSRFLFFNQLIVSTVFYHHSLPLTISLSLTLLFHFHFPTSPLFTLSLQWRHSMNNSKALQDDNGKLEVRLCVVCVCVCV